MVAGAIFGDGLAAAIVGPAAPGQNGPRLLDTLTYTDAATQAMMAFNVSDKGFQIRLSARVPEVLKTVVPGLVTEFLAGHSLQKDDIRFWAIHPGGAKIVDYLQEGLGLPAEAVHFSRQVLRRYGNMSSATIFFVLNEIMQHGRPQPGDYGLLQAFGPGLTVELCLVRW
jgi:alkylresorcinol/alkylpyrone synthase